MSLRARSLVGPLVAVAVLGGCTADGGSDASTSTTTADPGTAQSTVPDDPELSALLLEPGDLPAGFAPSDDVDDTISAFCAGQDATTGLSADGRAIVGFTRTPPGASVIEVVFRFEPGDAARFVDQSEELLTSCSDVPDATGLAFTYEPLTPAVAATLEGADARAGRYGTSVGSGNLTVEVAVLQEGDLGVLVAVLGLEEPRSALDALAATAFGAALAALEG